jgi:hypothetical protein
MGNGMEAGRHVDATGHPVEQLSQEMSDAVRENQRRERGLPDAADFITYAEFRKKVAAASGSR